MAAEKPFSDDFDIRDVLMIPPTPETRRAFADVIRELEPLADTQRLRSTHFDDGSSDHDYFLTIQCSAYSSKKAGETRYSHTNKLQIMATHNNHGFLYNSTEAAKQLNAGKKTALPPANQAMLDHIATRYITPEVTAEWIQKAAQVAAGTEPALLPHEIENLLTTSPLPLSDITHYKLTQEFTNGSTIHGDWAIPNDDSMLGNRSKGRLWTISLRTPKQQIYQYIRRMNDTEQLIIKNQKELAGKSLFTDHTLEVFTQKIKAAVSSGVKK